MSTAKAAQNAKRAVPKAAAPAPFEVERHGRHLGAEISGLDLSKPLDSATFEALEAALVEHKVLFARDQTMTTAEHVRLSRRASLAALGRRWTKREAVSVPERPATILLGRASGGAVGQARIPDRHRRWLHSSTSCWLLSPSTRPGCVMSPFGSRDAGH